MDFNWYSADLEPPEPGIYFCKIRQFDDSEFFSYVNWDGKAWPSDTDVKEWFWTNDFGLRELESPEFQRKLFGAEMQQAKTSVDRMAEALSDFCEAIGEAFQDLLVCMAGLKEKVFLLSKKCRTFLLSKRRVTKKKWSKGNGHTY